ncbi:MAG TPA: alkaline phosphatase PhoX [Gemmatimonadales bacterium]|nr:alkaline phosphatase PhoX [Gemmatimonadales bacterium]
MTNLDRRAFLRWSAWMGGAVLAPSMSGLISCSRSRYSGGDPSLRPARIGEGGYGVLLPSSDVAGVISIPTRFHAALLSTSGEEMIDGVVPNGFDGMAAFDASAGRVRLVRNHELRDTVSGGARPFGERAYDAAGPAGTTTLEVQVRTDGEARLVKQFASLAGTCVNCAGGSTPWGSWISCEETVAGTGEGWTRNHGYPFEVRASAEGTVVPVPLTAMGRFEHEALAVDPVTGWIYQTEDRKPAGFYRFKPRVRGQLHQGGTLEALAIVGLPGHDTGTGQTILAPRKVEWVGIDEPDSDSPVLPSGFVFKQALEKGAAQFARLEGCWYGDDSIYFNATVGGNAGVGQVWQYHISRDELQLVFESPSPAILNSPDNICVSPRGGIVLCEDATGTNYVRGLTKEGAIFDLVRNNINNVEWAGACFSPSGSTLFVNMQGNTRPLEAPSGDKAMTFAIWGPWESGAL